MQADVMTAKIAEGNMTVHAPAHSPFGGSVAARVLRLPRLRPPRRASAGASAQDVRLRGARHGAAMQRWSFCSTRANISKASSARRSTTTRSRATTSKPRCGRLSPTWMRSSTPGAEFYLERRVVFPTIAGAFGTVDLIVRIGGTVHVIDFKFGSRRARPRALSRRRRGRHQRAVAVLRRRRAPLAS